MQDTFDSEPNNFAQEQSEPFDYLHPEGKPDGATEYAEDGKPDAKSFQKALEDADGHSIKKPDGFVHGAQSIPPDEHPERKLV